MPVDRASLPPLQRRRFATGSEVLDFVHTGGVGAWHAAELVDGPTDLDLWLGVVLGPRFALSRATWRPPGSCARHCGS